MIAFAGTRPVAKPPTLEGYSDGITQIPAKDVRDFDPQPLRLTRRGKLVRAVGVAAIVGLTAAAGGEYLQSQHVADERSYKLHHPWLLPDDQVVRMRVTNERDGISIASEFTSGADNVQELGEIISSEGTGPGHTIMPGQEVGVPRVFITLPLPKSGN